MIGTGDVCAVLVTRGDQPDAVARICEALVFDEIVVWDNSLEHDWKIAGRYLAAIKSGAGIVYFQDDDVTVPEATQRALLAAYEPGVVVAVYAHGENPDGYENIPLVGAGAILDSELCETALDRYLDVFPLDDGFMYEADYIAGALYPKVRQLRLPFTIDLVIAQDPSRLCNQPWQAELKRRICDQARALRDGRAHEYPRLFHDTAGGELVLGEMAA